LPVAKHRFVLSLDGSVGHLFVGGGTVAFITGEFEFFLGGAVEVLATG
tara:strand:- start:1210 stop:1353 length:144 start_codon:yes stop_codon:yes gene_type:complete